LACLAENHHQQVTSTITRVLVGQAQINYCEVKRHKTEHIMYRVFLHSCTMYTPNGCGFTNYSTVYSEGRWGFACQCFHL